MSRVGLSKGIRFSIFKRDGFACQYCGAHPPKAVLEVDHIVPVATGGDNDTTNLVTACFDCNRGKGATGLEVVPQSLADRAAEVREREEQLKGYNAILQAQRQRVEDDVWEVFGRWRGQEATTHERFSSVKNFIARIGLHEVLDAVDITLSKNIRSEAGEFKYFCGVCWGKIREAENG